MSGYQTDKEMELQEALLRMIRVASRNHCVIEGVITDFDNEAFTCTVQCGDGENTIEFSDVSLEVLVGSQASFTLLPVIGSDCLLVFRDGHQDRPQMLKIDQVDIIQANPKTKFIHGTGEDGGLPLSSKVAEEENKAQNDLNTLKDLISGWTPVSGDGGASLKLLLTTWFSDRITPTKQSDIESTTVFQ